MTWLPGLLVLVAGVAAGLLLARGFKRGKKPSRSAGLELRIADLEARRDDLYERLREINRGVGPEEDRAPLELAAARTLQELDRLEGDLSERHPKRARQRARARAKGAEMGGEPETAAPAPSPARHFITGFAYGAGLLLLVGGLVYWAVRDAKPRPDAAQPTPAAPASGEAHPEMGDLPPAVADRIASISSYLETAPDDLGARKQLGYTYLGASRFVEAFQQAEEILARQPEDPDGLYMQGLVRLTMGQTEVAEQLLQRALATDPDHVDSLTATGIISLRRANYPQAIAIWKQGLAAIGGSNEMIERLITLAEQGRPIEEILGMGRPQPDRPPAEARFEPPSPLTSPDVITVSLELAPGATPIRGSTLYLILRGEGDGPPVAVKRVDAPAFPIRLTLGQADSMMGSPIPESGSVAARLDADGDVSTRDPGDLEATTEASLGEAITLRLAPPP